MPVVLGASSLVIGGLLGALAVRRRRQLRARPARHRVAVPPDDAGRLEWISTRTEATVDADVLDAALRSLCLANWDGIELPALRSVQLAPDRAVLTLAARASLPEPFDAVGDEDDWELDAHAPLPLAPHEAGAYCAPFPTLVSVATDDADTTLLIDLEQLGVLRLTGDRDRAVALLRHMGAELANSRWAEDVEIVLVGFGDELTALNPERLRSVPDLATALAELAAHIRNVQANVERLPVRSVLDGRLRDIAADTWLPIVVLAAADPDPAEMAVLDELARELDGGRLAASIVVTADGPDGNHVHVYGDGGLSVTGIGDGGWHAASMTQSTGSGLAAILAPTTEPYPEAGPAIEDQPWAQDMDADGSLSQPPSPEPQSPGPQTSQRPIPGPPVLQPPIPQVPFLGPLLRAVEPVSQPPAPEPSTSEPPIPGPPIPGPPISGPPTPGSLLTQPPIPAPRIPEPPLPVPRAPEPGPDPDMVRRLAIVDHQDPDLDDDLARWQTTGTTDVPLIAILGEPAVRAPGELPIRPKWFAEVLVYLSLHPAGVTPSKALTDLWPEGQKIRTTTVRHAFYGARRWAGRGLDGDPDKAFVSDMANDNTYRIRGHLLDWDLFRRLRKRGHARHSAQHPGAVEDYEAALRLVRGPVLSGLRHDGYAWLNNHDQRHDLQIPGFVVDTAHELVDIALAAGDTATARRAAETARRVDIDLAYDRPLTDLMRIAHAEHNPSEMESHAAILLAARGFDVPEELPPDTFAVLNELLPAGPRRPRS